MMLAIWIAVGILGGYVLIRALPLIVTIGEMLLPVFALLILVGLMYFVITSNQTRVQTKSSKQEATNQIIGETPEELRGFYSSVQNAQGETRYLNIDKHSILKAVRDGHGCLTHQLIDHFSFEGNLAYLSGYQVVRREVFSLQSNKCINELKNGPESYVISKNSSGSVRQAYILKGKQLWVKIPDLDRELPEAIEEYEKLK